MSFVDAHAPRHDATRLRYSVFTDRPSFDSDVFHWTGLPTEESLRSLVTEVVNHRGRMHRHWVHDYDEHRAVVIALVFLRTPLSVGCIMSLFDVSSGTTCMVLIDEVIMVVSHLAGTRTWGGLGFPLSEADQKAHYGHAIDNNTITNIVDNTYWYTNTPTDIDLARLLRDKMFKKRHYIKVAVHCSTRGYVFAVDGPFASAGSANDALTLTEFMLPGRDLNQLARLGGVMLADAGYEGTRTPPSDRAGVPFVFRTTGRHRRSKFGMRPAE